MKKSQPKASKTKITQELTKLGLGLRRDFEKKVWVLSNGKTAKSLFILGRKLKIN